MATAAEKMPKVLSGLDRALGVLAAVTLFFMMGVTFIDVAMRKVLPGTFPAADELTKMSLGVLIFAALPPVTARREHVVISLFERVVLQALERDPNDRGRRCERHPACRACLAPGGARDPVRSL